jgi:hypothetical protein
MRNDSGDGTGENGGGNGLMEISMRRLVTACLAIGALMATTHNARAELWLRSDLPLSGTPGTTSWPQPCPETDRNVIAMCARFALGIWREQFANCGADHSDQCQQWMKLEIYSLTDGGLSYWEAYRRDGFGDSSDPAAIIELSSPSDVVGLYAIQIGFRGGSRYLLVSASRNGRPITRASILDVRCPIGARDARMRKARYPTFFLPDYCVVDSVGALRRMAQEALNRSPFATMEWVENPGSA